MQFGPSISTLGVSGAVCSCRSVSFCVFCYSVQPGITINYADGTSHEVCVSTGRGVSFGVSSSFNGELSTLLER